MIIKALTVWQPWATMIMAGVKPYEFRGWAAPKAMWNTRIAIHAGARKPRKSEMAGLLVRLNGASAWLTGLIRDRRGLDPGAIELLEKWIEAPEMLPLSSILGTVLLGEPIIASKIMHEFGGPVNDSDRDAHCNFAWPVSDPMAEPPIPMRGFQGFWNLQIHD